METNEPKCFSWNYFLSLNKFRSGRYPGVGLVFSELIGPEVQWEMIIFEAKKLQLFKNCENLADYFQSFDFASKENCYQILGGSSKQNPLLIFSIDITNDYSHYQILDSPPKNEIYEVAFAFCLSFLFHPIKRVLGRNEGKFIRFWTQFYAIMSGKLIMLKDKI